MDSFWSKLLILGIVAAIGLFFIHNVYTPQRSAQEAMADSTQQSVNAVKAGVDETLSSVSGIEVKNIAENNFLSTDEKKIVIEKVSGAVYTFETGTSMSTSCQGTTTGNQPLSSVVVDSKSYRQSISLDSITFIEK